jgi:hypothetical protein
MEGAVDGLSSIAGQVTIMTHKERIMPTMPTIAAIRSSLATENDQKSHIT